MRLGRLLIVLAIVVILGVVALYAYFNLTAPNVEGEGAQGTTDIVIVVQPIPRGGIITAEALGYLAFPTEDTIANMFTSIDQVVGGRARYDLEPGLPLTTNMVVSSASDLSETGSDPILRC